MWCSLMLRPMLLSTWRPWFSWARTSPSSPCRTMTWTPWRPLWSPKDKRPGVWYLADGVYSMYGDTAPMHHIATLLDEYEQLHVYIDDAHGFSWKGLHGRGHALATTPMHPRLVVAVSLAKSFGSGGAALAFHDAGLARKVLLRGSTFTFSGPIHPAELGAAVVAADIHLSPEHGGSGCGVATSDRPCAPHARGPRSPSGSNRRHPHLVRAGGQPGQRGHAGHPDDGERLLRESTAAIRPCRSMQAVFVSPRPCITRMTS